MKEKLQQLMKSEGLTSSRMAEILGIQPSGISHILAGRNKPGFDLLQKILRRFPRVNPDWLLLDSEQMYRTGNPKSSSSTNGTDAGMVGLTPDCSGRNWNRDRTPPVRSLHRHKRPRTTTSCRSKPIRFFKPSPAMTGIPSCALFWSMPIAHLRP